MAAQIVRFEVYWADLDPTVDREIKKTRPVVVVSPDELNRHLGTVLAAPLTTTIRGYPFRPVVEVDGRTGQIALDQMRALDKARLAKRIGALDDRYQEEILRVLREMFC